ncbi:MAG: cob(I)yrinic acid a,c-diamide adenosyltransferase [Actinomycetota bacterium]|nr:cob(I)yrinic acid a,c-diamide adenosyltransferase [Actinomycetota bacterium]
MPRIYTKTGDDGTTGMLYGGRISKGDRRTEAYGTSDEAVAALGVARAQIADPELRLLILRLQRELFVVGADLGSNPGARDKLVDGQTRVSTAMVETLETLIDEYADKTVMPKEFVIPGESPGSAALDLSRSIVRRCERLVVRLIAQGAFDNRDCLRYLNRLSDLLFVLARHEEAGFTPLHEHA